MSFQSPEPDGAAAASAVKGPAIFLVVVAILGLLASGGSLAVSSFIRETALQDENLDETGRKAIELMYGVGAWVIHGWGFLASLIALFGGISMLKLRSWGFAMTACILIALNVSGCCCVLGLGPAIWGLIVLSKPGVKAAFR
jgi:hypothetical protein